MHSGSKERLELMLVNKLTNLVYDPVIVGVGNHFTVKPPVSRHPQDQKKCPFKRGVRLWEDENVVFICRSENTSGVRLWEVSISGRLTVISF